MDGIVPPALPSVNGTAGETATHDASPGLAEGHRKTLVPLNHTRRANTSFDSRRPRVVSTTRLSPVTSSSA
jgi:hypothetical protein